MERFNLGSKLLLHNYIKMSFDSYLLDHIFYAKVCLKVVSLEFGKNYIGMLFTTKNFFSLLLL